MTSTTLTTKQVNFVKEIELMAKRDNNDIATTLRLYKTESLVKMARAYKIKLGKSRARDNICAQIAEVFQEILTKTNDEQTAATNEQTATKQEAPEVIAVPVHLPNHLSNVKVLTPDEARRIDAINAMKEINKFTTGCPSLFKFIEYRDFIKKNKKLNELRELASKFHIQWSLRHNKTMLASAIADTVDKLATYYFEVVEPSLNQEQPTEIPAATQEPEIARASDTGDFVPSQLNGVEIQRDTDTITQPENNPPAKPTDYLSWKNPGDKPTKKSLLTLDAINACETREEIYDILMTAKKKGIVEFVKKYGISLVHLKGLNTTQKVATYCAAKILIIRNHYEREKQKIQTQIQEGTYGPVLQQYIYPVTYVNKKQQITIDFEATEKLINETQFDN